VATGADRLAGALSRLGLTHVFGLPGTQSVALFEGLRRSPLRTILATHEMNAAFMAAGFYRASGRPAALASIPGPGFTHALSGVVEARHDSTALIHLVGPPSSAPGRRFRLQAVDQSAIGQLETKGVFEVAALEGLERAVQDAWTRAVTGEPGPVVLHVHQHVLTGSALSTDPAGQAATPPPPASNDGLAAAAEALSRARRPVLLAGQGAAGGADDLRRLAEALGAPVATSCSGRGVIPEDHPLALAFDTIRSSVAALNELLASSDCILVLGYKLTHNGTAGFRMRLPPHALVHVDAEPGVLGANYPAAVPVVADAPLAARRLLASLGDAPVRTAWTQQEIAGWRNRFATESGDDTPEPRVAGASPPSARQFFTLLRHALPREAIVVTDSGLHQILVRRHHSVLSPRGLIVPSDYQSMGFGIPAAIGAKLGAPERPVVAIVGDGGFAMTGMELLTAVRERVPLTVVVFNDGYLNLIRQQQHGASGRSTAVTLQNPDFQLMAGALGVEYRAFDGEASFERLAAPDQTGVTLIEVQLGDSPVMVRQQFSGLARASARRALGPRLVQTLKRWLGRR